MLAVALIFLAALTGSAVGGLTIALDAMGPLPSRSGADRNWSPLFFTGLP